MSEEIIEISHETIGRNLLLYPMLRKLKVSEIISNHCQCESEIPIGIIAETIILSQFSKERVPMYKLQQFCKKSSIRTIYSIDTTKINDDRAGRALDYMYDSLSDMKASIIIGAQKEFDVSVDKIHFFTK